MKLTEYLRGKDRAEFASKINTTLNYLNNLCQRPERAGKNIIFRIVAETRGEVGFDDFKKQGQGAQIVRRGRHFPK